jgi:hypothetical protein
MSAALKRQREDSEEEEIISAFVLYSESIRRGQQACASYVYAVNAVIRAYVKHRGGDQACRVFATVPSRSFDPALICEKSFVQEFRFTHAEMDRVVLALLNAGFPRKVKSKARDKCSLYEAVCMMCCKYAWPERLGSMGTKVFFTSVSRMSRLISALRKLIFHHFHGKLAMPDPVSAARLEEFCAAVKVKSGHSLCFGFIDGTVRPMCKPSFLQGINYTGKDRTHALKYQALTCPDGMFLQLCGPWPGSRHDQYMVRESKLLPYIQSLPRRRDGGLYVVYADQGYSDDVGVETPYFDAAVNAQHEAFNQAMASSRITVEWQFGGILQNWAANDMVRLQQLLSNRKIGQVYIVSGFLCNLLNTLRPNNTSQYFGVQPPMLEAYLVSMYQA